MSKPRKLTAKQVRTLRRLRGGHQWAAWELELPSSHMEGLCDRGLLQRLRRHGEVLYEITEAGLALLAELDAQEAAQ